MNRNPRAAPLVPGGKPPAQGPGRKLALIFLLAFVALMWVIEAADQVIIAAIGPRQTLDQYGVSPLSLDGLLGILFQPLLHGDWAHLIGNSIGLLVLGAIIALSGIRPLIAVTIVSWLMSGVASWLMGGSGTVHIGASGIVFGYIFYVIVRGLFTRRILHIVVGLIVGFYYGLEALAGLSPMLDGVSWQGHLGGAIGGVATAYGSRKDRSPRKVTAGSTGWTTGPRR